MDLTSRGFIPSVKTLTPHSSRSASRPPAAALRPIGAALALLLLAGADVAAGGGEGRRAAAGDVALHLSRRGGLWDQSAASLRRRLSGHRWDERSQALRASVPASFDGVALTASVLRFEEGRPVRWEWWLYDRPTEGIVADGWVEERARQARRAATSWAFGGEPLAIERPDGSSALVWGRAPTILSLETVHDSTQSRVMRLMLVAEPWPPRRAWRRLVRTTDQGARILRVPMVEQRRQGYCAPATVERVMRYYGIPLGADSLAKLADSSAENGTDVHRMMQAIAGLRGMGCEVRTLLGFDMRRYQRTLHAYNAAARAAGDPPIDWSPPVLDLARTFLRADGERLRDVASRQHERMTFWGQVRRSIDDGVPLVWGVVLGIVPEPGIGPQTRGGHLRLIVGYDPSARQILYSDPWGEPHALKRLSLDDAWAMTMSLHAIVPPP